jgi:ATP-dependent Clp protease ATP-binding subunit ClpC
MSNKLDRFTPQALRALRAAQVEALRLKHEAIGPEHILLGLLTTHPAAALECFGLNAQAVVFVIEQIAQPGQFPLQKRPPLSQEGKHTIELAVLEAVRLEHHYIGCDHLLIGVARSEQGLMPTILNELSVTARGLIRAAHRRMRRSDPKSKLEQ